ncbi:MAG: aspartate--tRNA ligase [DPANN group archaeon]|nr:aspartate--tRNA ligase [DPANN group archaeon]
MLRTHTCGELDRKAIGKKVILSGWVNAKRTHGGIIFIDLRDRYGITQLVFDSSAAKAAYVVAEQAEREFVLQAKGDVRARGKGLENKERSTGQIEVSVQTCTILASSDALPVEMTDETTAFEDTRLKYRYLDLRRKPMQENILRRHAIVRAVRSYLDALGFVDVETPVLARSTPEGARDYLVPSRIHPGKFFALPQSPQIFKQLLMVSGFDRYYQIVKCFRDEDLRADRQPEFTQIDIELSFVEEEDIYTIMEGMMQKLWKDVLDVQVKIPFRRIPYREAMSSYGSDKPDLRFGLELHDVSSLVQRSDFKVFKGTVDNGGKVYAINAKGCAGFSRKEIEKLEEVAKIYDAKGLAYMPNKDGFEGGISKFIGEDVQKALIKELDVKKGDLLLFVGDAKHHLAQVALGQVRLALAKKLKLAKEGDWKFAWITEFPLFEYDEDEKRHISVHHPFTAPYDDDLEYLETDPGKIRSRAYDLTLNGVELGGGSIRINKKELQQKMFTAMGISDKEAKQKFGFLLEAFRYGAPPHGGIAFGLDRIVALMSGEESIREVIAFPKNKACVSLMDDAPNVVDDRQLEELHIKKK